MKEKLDQLLYLAMKHSASDVHFVVQNHHVKATLRGMQGLIPLHSMAIDESLFHYLRYISNMDLGYGNRPQSGNFTYTFQNETLYFRFATLSTLDKQTGVLRILNNHKPITLKNLSQNKQDYESFVKWTKTRSGLVVLCGPTGSGKSTTLHAIMHEIALKHELRAISLEDPIEIYDDTYLQLQINERNHFSYEEGIKEMMRHDPDVIMIGEIRDPNSAKMMLRSALSGHMIFTTIHARTCNEAIHRLEEFGLPHNDLQHVLTAICAQRIYTDIKKEGRVCIYEIMEGKQLAYCLQHNQPSTSYKDITKHIQNAIDKGQISAKEAEKDLIAFTG